MLSCGRCSSRVSARPGIMASTPGRVRGSVRCLMTASRKSAVPPIRPSPVRKLITDSQRSSCPEGQRGAARQAGDAHEALHLDALVVERLHEFGEQLAVGGVGGAAPWPRRHRARPGRAAQPRCGRRRTAGRAVRCAAGRRPCCGRPDTAARRPGPPRNARRGAAARRRQASRASSSALRIGLCVSVRCSKA